MAAATQISLEEYLKTTYRPDRDYVDGEVLERNLGERDHSQPQTLLAAYFLIRQEGVGIMGSHGAARRGNAASLSHSGHLRAAR